MVLPVPQSKRLPDGSVGEIILVLADSVEIVIGQASRKLDVLIGKDQGSYWGIESLDKKFSQKNVLKRWFHLYYGIVICMIL